MISQNEREERLERLNALMEREDLDACLLIGSGAWGPKEYGYFRYFVDNRIYYYIQAFMAVKGEKPTVICGSPTHLAVLQSRGFEDILMRGDNIKNGIVETMELRGLGKAKIGFCPDTIPASWYDLIIDSFPGACFKDISVPLYALRCERSEEEKSVVKQSAAVADNAIEAIRTLIVPGVSENEISAELCFAMKKNKAEECMVRLETVGMRYNGRPAIHTAFNSAHTLEQGEREFVELSCRYEGYWARCARTALNGEADQCDGKALSAVLEALDAGCAALKPGASLSSAAVSINSALAAKGYAPNENVGAVCGVDLCELPLASYDGVFFEGQAVFLQAFACENGCGVLFGDTYLVSAEGGVRLSSSNRELVCAG